MATERLNSILSHLTPSKSGLSTITQKNPTDIVITYAIRTPLCKAFKGGMKDTPLDDLVLQTLQNLVEESKIDPTLIEDVCLGNVNNPRAAYIARAASLAASIPHTAGASTTNRFCSSGLKAIQEIATQIATNSITIGVAIGAESMSTSPSPSAPFSSTVMANPESRDCLQPMGQTSENLGRDFGVSREQQDEYAAESYARAERAQRAGWFEEEVFPFRARVVRRDPESGEEGEGEALVLRRDEGPRWGTTVESLAKIRPAFKEFGDRSTGGNSSQVTDGAAAVLLMTRARALELGQPVLAKFVGATVAGVPPRVMGIGPSVAVPKLLGKFRLGLRDVDVVELNEAFASMAVYCRDVLGLDWERMNARGGAIALGHPLGATGVRQLVTGLSECRRRKVRVLLTSMCIGTGQGMAGLFVNEVL